MKQVLITITAVALTLAATLGITLTSANAGTYQVHSCAAAQNVTGQCAAGSAPVGNGTLSLNVFPVGGYGEYTLTVWYVNEAGLRSVDTSIGLELQPPTSPPPPPVPPLPFPVSPPRDPGASRPPANAKSAKTSQRWKRGSNSKKSTGSSSSGSKIGHSHKRSGQGRGRAAARLSVGSLKVKRGVVLVAGGIDKRFSGMVTVEYRAGKRTIRKKVKVHAGRFKTTLRTGQKTLKHSHGRLKVLFKGSKALKPATVKK